MRIILAAVLSLRIRYFKFVESAPTSPINGEAPGSAPGVFFVKMHARLASHNCELLFSISKSARKPSKFAVVRHMSGAPT